MNFEGNPFFWGFEEQCSLKTLAKQTNATYNEPRDTVEQKTAMDNFFEENVATSPNPAFITGCTALDPLPYEVEEGTSDGTTTTKEEDNNC